MTLDELIPLLTRDGVRALEADGDHFFVYDPAGDLPPERQMPFATIVSGDTYDTASDLSRPGLYRLNLGLTKATYRSLFGPKGPDDYDLTQLDVVLPHPIYAAQHWVGVITPSAETMKQQVLPLIDEAYEFAARKYRNHQARLGS